MRALAGRAIGIAVAGGDPGRARPEYNVLCFFTLVRSLGAGGSDDVNSSLLRPALRSPGRSRRALGIEVLSIADEVIE